jgi:hypothetical protein
VVEEEEEEWYGGRSTLIRGQRIQSAAGNR